MADGGICVSFGRFFDFYSVAPVVGQAFLPVYVLEATLAEQSETKDRQEYGNALTAATAGL